MNNFYLGLSIILALSVVNKPKDSKEKPIPQVKE